MNKDGRLCVRCGKSRHIRTECADPALAYWEQAYFKEIVFGQSAQVNYSIFGFETSEVSSSSSNGEGSYTPRSNFIEIVSSFVSVRSLTVFPTITSVKGVQSFFDETSAPGKKPYHPESIPQPIYTFRETEPKKTRVVYPPQAMLPPQPFQPSQPYQPSQTFQQMPFQTPSAPPKKGKKRGKKAEPMPLVGMYNEERGGYDNAVSIRKMFQQHKVDMSWMDLIAWSPAVNKEVKRLCTRVSKPRQQKAPRRDAPQQFTYQFNPSM